MYVALDLPGATVQDIGGEFDEWALNIEHPYIVPCSLDQVTGDLITSPNFVIDSPMSEVQQYTSRESGGQSGAPFSVVYCWTWMDAA